MTIERTRSITGYTLYQVWHEDNIIASFDSYCDAVDFIRFFEEI